MINNFTHVFNKVLFQVKSQIGETPNNEFYNILDNSIIVWCKQLNFSYNIQSYIDAGKNEKEIAELIDEIKKDWFDEFDEIEKNKSDRFKQNFLKQWLEQWLEQWRKRKKSLIQIIFKKINVQTDQGFGFIVILGFVITSVGYCIYLLNQPKQQETTTHETDYRPSSPSSDQVSPPISTVASPPAQPIVKNLLILAISVAKLPILESIKAKEKIDYDDGEKIYEATQYLCQNTETNLSHQWNSIEDFFVQPGEESEYDIYLVKIWLNKPSEGFKPNVNQLDRYDAFRDLSNLAVKIEVSPRCQMEIYRDFDFYSR